MRRGFTDFSAKSVVDLAVIANAAPVAAESLMKRRRVVVMCALTFLVIASEVEESLIVKNTRRLPAAWLRMTKPK